MSDEPKKSKRPASLTFDYTKGDTPPWVREMIETHLAIEAEDAKSAGALGFMARALVIATMPYKDPKTDAFTRKNGDFRLRIVAGYEGGIPYGVYPRLLMSWVATEAARNKSPVIELGESLRLFMRDVLDIKSSSGGSRGSGPRVSEQMKRLFGSLITAQYSGSLEHRGFQLRNILIAESLDMTEDDEKRIDNLSSEPENTTPTGHTTAELKSETKDGALWTPQSGHEAGQWRSQVRLTTAFYKECVTNPVPIDLRAYKQLRSSPLAMDVYTWLTYRLSYTHRRTRPIPWELLMQQFGSSYNPANPGQAVRDFKKAFIRALTLVQYLYSAARVELNDNGLVLLPSPSHIAPVTPKIALQRDLWDKPTE